MPPGQISRPLWSSTRRTGSPTDPYYWVALGNLGSCRLAQYDFPSALERLEGRLEEPGIPRKRRADTLEEVAKAHALQGDHGEAARILREVLELYGPGVEVRALRVSVLASLGEQLVELEDPSAEGPLVEVLDTAPLVTVPPHYAKRARRAERLARLQLARLAFQQGDVDAAGVAAAELIEEYGSLSIDPDATWFDAILLRAVCLEESGEREAAGEFLRTRVDWAVVAELDPIRRERLLAARERLLPGHADSPGPPAGR